MEKVDEKWLLDNGWEKDSYPIDEIDNGGEHGSIHIFTKKEGRAWVKDFKYARIDHKKVTFSIHGKTKKSNFWTFNCLGNGFTIENRISFRKFTVEQIESALKIIGL